MFYQSITVMMNYYNYFFELFLIPQVKGDVEQRQEGVDKLEKCHFAYQMIIIFRLLSIIFYQNEQINNVY